MKEKIRKYLEEASLSGSNKIDDTSMIFEDGLLDSMGLLFLIEYLNEEFNIEITDMDLNPKNFESINKIVQFIDSKSVKQN